MRESKREILISLICRVFLRQGGKLLLRKVLFEFGMVFWVVGRNFQSFKF
jgi:hypothetical protein